MCLYQGEIKRLIRLNKNLTHQYNRLFKKKIQPAVIAEQRTAELTALYAAQKNGELFMKILPELKKRRIDPASFYQETETMFFPKKEPPAPPKEKVIERWGNFANKPKKVICVETGEVFKSVAELSRHAGYKVSHALNNGHKIHGKTYKILEE